ncbi:MAG: DUF3786 domain-containing protein [Thermoplasmata archaeon]|nr:MAG: DUF3786 domain-containing protein [Thermoplasmata archaeon]
MSQQLKKVTYEAAINNAWDELCAVEPDEVVRNARVTYNSDDGYYILPFLGEIYHVFPEKRKVKDSRNQDVYPFLAVLLLHYLTNAKDIEPEGKLISFRELEGGDIYYSAFCARAINKITEAFGQNPEILTEVGNRINAMKGVHGDISIIINAFPKIPVTVILWKGDEEVPSSSNMLFDASIAELLPTEDVAVLGGFVASNLKKTAESLQI